MSTIEIHRTVENPFSIECIEEGTDLEKLRYHGRGERRYGIGRQLLSRTCHDALVDYDDGDIRGIVLIRRDAEPARGYLWCLGGFYDKGLEGPNSLSDRVKRESGLDVDASTMIKLGDARMIWKTTPYKFVEVKKEIRDTFSDIDPLKITLQEIIRLAQEKGFIRDLSTMNLQSIADLVQEKGLPEGIDDFGNLFYARATGELKLDFLHKDPMIITPEMYTSEFKETLHPYILFGMDRAIKLLLRR